MRRSFFRSAGLALTLLLLGAGTALATAMIRQDLDTLTTEADVILRGRVARVQSRWTQDHLKIVTDVDLEVTESLKGGPPSRVRVLQPGGEVDGIGQQVLGLAEFQTGEEVVVFLQSRPGALYQVVGAAQGKYRIERSTDGKRAVAVPSKVNAVLLDAVTQQPVTAEARTLELEDLRSQVRATLKRQELRKDRP